MRAIPIQTRYAGCRFRSRLEARWAVFFKTLGIPWLYEPQGFFINRRSYLPDFLLTDCGTYVEVKGGEEDLDHDFMLAVAAKMPTRRCKQGRGPRLLILGPIPEVPEQGDLGWVGIDIARWWRGEVRDGDRSYACSVRLGDWQCECGCHVEKEDPARAEVCDHLIEFADMPDVSPEAAFLDQWWGFGSYHRNLSPQVLTNTSQATPVDDGGPDSEWLTPALDPYAEMDPAVAKAYVAARSARFEHGARAGR